MARKGLIESNERKKKLRVSFRKKRDSLKKVIQDKKGSMDDRFQAVLRLAAMPRSGSRVRLRNRCVVSGRARGYYRHLGLSRIALRELASSGALPGMAKSSW